ncbi:MAG TPA: hypothetical protein VHO46_05125 [Bacteroidales bacterium]|nr:hypothetical protein [Bacteroidales bacterium]
MSYIFCYLYGNDNLMDELIISNPEFNRMSSSLLELESGTLMTDCELDTLIFEFYFCN